MKKFLFVFSFILLPMCANAAYCLVMCGTNDTTQSFCNTKSNWCGSSSDTTIESVGVNPNSLSTRYCTPLYGAFGGTLSVNTYIVCYATPEECMYTNWTSQSGGKELLSGHSCREDHVNTAASGMANKWRCAKNYYCANCTGGIGYKTGSVATTITCTACPNSGLTSGPEMDSITDCYLPAGTFADTTGTYTRDNCPYQN